MSNPDWSKIHSQEKSWRHQLQGDVVAGYVLERYLELFREAFQGERPLSFLELGSGNGDLSRLIVGSGLPFVGRYVVSEYFSRGVDWLRGLGLEALQLDAQRIKLPDDAFDVVLSFDVMHHVDNPAAMAAEMVRISRGRVLLTEANGLSLGRKLFELSPGHRAAGERSYLPRRYLDFFRRVPGCRITRARVYPFLFVFKTPCSLAPAVIGMSRAMERLPLVNWQCATVCLDLAFEKIR